MSDTISERVNARENNGETCDLNERKLADINIADKSQSTPVTSEKVASQIKAVPDPFSKQLELLCDLMEDIQRSPIKRSAETSGLM